MKIDEVKKIRKRCLVHAEDLLSAANLLLRSKQYNIAYHLTVLALEEVGKLFLVMVGHSHPDEAKRSKVLETASEDHAKKIFWALWGPMYGKDDMSPKQMDDFLKWAENIHGDRKKGLYVDPYGEIGDPSKMIIKGQVERLIGMVNARVQLEKCHSIRKPSKKKIELLEWFQNASKDSARRNQAINPSTIKKLKEFKGDVYKWMQWLKKQEDKHIAEMQKMVENEINRKEPKAEEKYDPKWKVKYKLITSSHYFRQPELNKMNNAVQELQLTAGNSTKEYRELIIEQGYSKGLPVYGLYQASWVEARRFALSLCIAARGFFWWYLPKDISKFYEKITDLETNTEIVVERKPRLVLNWGNHKLTFTDLFAALKCYRFLPRENVEFLTAYMTGISFFGKSDIHTPMEKEIFLDFYNSLRSSMIYYKDIKSDDEVDSVIKKMLKEHLSILETALKIIGIARKIMRGESSEKPITLSECGTIKLLTDLYVMKKIDDLVKKDEEGSRKTRIKKKDGF